MKRVLILAFLLVGHVRAESIIKLPALAIHGGTNKYVEATGKTATTNDILEFIAVSNGGRDYESLFTLDCQPSALKFALLMIGCEPGESNGSPVSIEMEWQGKRVSIEKFLIDRRAKKPPASLPWIFTGSYFTKNPVDGKDVFLADEEQAFIALWWQPSALINLSRESGNPYRGKDQGFEANPKLLPPQGTPIKLIFRKRD